MPAKIRALHHTGWGATTLALAATIATLAAPAASALLEGPEVIECSNNTCAVPSTYVVGQSYSIFAGPPPDDALRVNFYDNGACVGGFSYAQPGNTLPWVPTTAGTHEITIKFSVSKPFEMRAPIKLTVNVLAAPPGSPTPPPTPAAQCTVTGSGTGSGGPTSGSSSPGL